MPPTDVGCTARAGWHASRDDDFRSPIVNGWRVDAQAVRDRIPSDCEIRSVGRPATRSHQAYARIVRSLLPSAARLNEIACLRWSEIDKTLPCGASHTKIEYVAHLSDLALHIERDSARSSTDGVAPFSGFSKAKGDGAIIAPATSETALTNGPVAPP